MTAGAINAEVSSQLLKKGIRISRGNKQPAIEEEDVTRESDAHISTASQAPR